MIINICDISITNGINQGFIKTTTSTGIYNLYNLDFYLNGGTYFMDVSNTSNIEVIIHDITTKGDNSLRVNQSNGNVVIDNFHSIEGDLDVTIIDGTDNRGSLNNITGIRYFIISGNHINIYNLTCDRFTVNGTVQNLDCNNLHTSDLILSSLTSKSKFVNLHITNNFTITSAITEVIFNELKCEGVLTLNALVTSCEFTSILLFKSMSINTDIRYCTFNGLSFYPLSATTFDIGRVYNCYFNSIRLYGSNTSKIYINIAHECSFSGIFSHGNSSTDYDIRINNSLYSTYTNINCDVLYITFSKHTSMSSCNVMKAFKIDDSGSSGLSLSTGLMLNNFVINAFSNYNSYTGQAISYGDRITFSNFLVYNIDFHINGEFCILSNSVITRFKNGGSAVTFKGGPTGADERVLAVCTISETDSGNNKHSGSAAVIHHNPW
jgi:hypothetical protein